MLKLNQHLKNFLILCFNFNMDQDTQQLKPQPNFSKPPRSSKKITIAIIIVIVILIIGGGILFYWQIPAEKELTAYCFKNQKNCPILKCKMVPCQPKTINYPDGSFDIGECFYPRICVPRFHK